MCDYDVLNYYEHNYIFIHHCYCCSIANYTVMIEKVPAKLRSVPMLRDFFDKLFPGTVVSYILYLGEPIFATY